ncbi:unnamed protein product [Phytophthora fragariaefolia]|uniref:Unnamed protein product n=1 Tax=Phytophthora fragariaefolia TaxID=1490495 RepID=A0A9W7D6Y2_9STRA|nr:unnamed protein product [Phytophthora fragariaefolia]
MSLGGCSDRPLAGAGRCPVPRVEATPPVMSRASSVRDPWMPILSENQSRYGNTAPPSRYAMCACSDINLFGETSGDAINLCSSEPLEAVDSDGDEDSILDDIDMADDNQDESDDADSVASSDSEDKVNPTFETTEDELP